MITYQKLKKAIGKNPLVFHAYQLVFRVVLEPMNRGQRIEYCTKYLNWFLLKKRRGECTEISLLNNMKSIVYPDSDSGVSSIFSNNVDHHESVFVRRNLKPGDFIVDAGCNVGNRTLALADIVGGGLLIDANPNCLSRAQKNFELNSLSLENYHFLQSAVGGENSTVMFPADTGTSCQNSINDGSDSKNLVEVPLVTLDTALDSIGKPDVSFIKTDLEGFDLDALRGARQTLQSDTIRLVLFERWATTELDDFLQFFTEIGWTVFALDKNGQPSISPRHLNQSRNLFATPERWRCKIIGSVHSTT